MTLYSKNKLKEKTRISTDFINSNFDKLKKKRLFKQIVGKSELLLLVSLDEFTKECKIIQKENQRKGALQRERDKRKNRTRKVT